MLATAVRVFSSVLSAVNDNMFANRKVMVCAKLIKHIATSAVRAASKNALKLA